MAGSPSTALGDKPWNGFKDMLEGDADWIEGFHTLSEETNATQASAACAQNLGRADVTVLYIHGPDHAGHRHGFAPHVRKYMQMIEAVDEALAPLLKAAEDAAHEDWLVLVTTDHGGTARSALARAQQQDLDRAQDGCEGVHGLDIPQHRATFVIAAYASGLKRGEIVPAPRNVDVTPTVLRHFGLTCAQPCTGCPIPLA
jgi:hypothetical protein